MKLSNLALATSIALMSSNAIAAPGDFWLNIHTVSWHSSEGFYALEGNYGKRSSTMTPYNNNNYGVDIEYEFEEIVSFKGGVFQNSIDNTSFFVGANWHTKYTDGFGVALGVGGATAYDEISGMAVTPMVVPAVNFIAGPVRMELDVLPGFGQYDTVVHLVFGVKF